MGNMRCSRATCREDQGDHRMREQERCCRHGAWQQSDDELGSAFFSSSLSLDDLLLKSSPISSHLSATHTTRTCSPSLPPKLLSNVFSFFRSFPSYPRVRGLLVGVWLVSIVPDTLNVLSAKAIPDHRFPVSPVRRRPERLLPMGALASAYQRCLSLTIIKVRFFSLNRPTSTVPKSSGGGIAREHTDTDQSRV